MKFIFFPWRGFFHFAQGTLFHIGCLLKCFLLAQHSTLYLDITWIACETANRAAEVLSASPRSPQSNPAFKLTPYCLDLGNNKMY